MTSQRSATIKRLSWGVAAILLAVGIYLYGIQRNRGLVPAWFGDVFFDAWGVLIVVGALALLHDIERRFLANIKPEKFKLLDGENLLFTASFVSCGLYPDTRTFDPQRGINNWLQPHTGLFGLGWLPIDRHLLVSNLLWFRLTDRRLVFGMLPSRTWRSIPLSDIVRVAEINGRWPYHNACLIEYRFDRRLEAIVFNNRSARYRELAEKLRVATL